MVVRVLGREESVEGQQKVVKTEVVRMACTAIKVSGQESPGARALVMSVSIVMFVTLLA
jgi:hypothetical protein